LKQRITTILIVIIVLTLTVSGLVIFDKSKPAKSTALRVKHHATATTIKPSISTTTLPVTSIDKVSKPWHAGMTELGIDYLTYINPDEPIDTVSAYAGVDLNHIVSLNANSVSISFPFYTSSVNATDIYSGSGTPTTSQLATIIHLATERGLRVTLRPLMDQGDLGGSNWRGNIAPSDISAWFSSYEKFLQPYFVMAQADGVSTFIVGAELSSLAGEPQWQGLVSAARNLFHGQLTFSSDFDVFHEGDRTPNVDVQGVDAYFPVSASNDASVPELQADWNSWWTSLPSFDHPSDVVIDEIGIAAQDGEYAQPYNVGVPGQPLNLAIQYNWFTAACQTVQKLHIAGIYFWNLVYNESPSNLASPGSFVGRPGEQAIKNCFANILSSS
jgi:hypothetical protein